MPLRAALDSLRARRLLPTALRTAVLDEIPADLRARAAFSATVTDAGFLADAFDRVDALLSGATDRATARLDLRNLLERTGYRPAPGEEGTITDLRSDRRLNLILDTNLNQAQGAGYHRSGQDPAVLDEWPGTELIRVRDSREPRDWWSRWEAAGGRVIDGRMVALKDSGVPERASRFGLAYGPPDFNSGMDWIDVDRAECEALGLMEPGDPAPAPEPAPSLAAAAGTSRRIDPASPLGRAVADSLAGIADFDTRGRLVPVAAA